MKYRIEFLASAEREFLRLPKAERKRIAPRLDALAENPRPHSSRKMSGYKDLWRLRVGAYRVVYAVEDGAMVVTITRIAHRRDVYRGL